MHNNQPDTRKRIALLIVISILSLIAAPLVPRFNTNTKAAQLPSPPYIPTFIRRVNLQANNLVTVKPRKLFMQASKAEKVV